MISPALQRGRAFGQFILAITLLVMTTAILTLTPTTNGTFLWLRWLAIMVLAWWLPGALLVAYWRLPAIDFPVTGVFAMGLGLIWMTVLLLLVHWWPGPLAQLSMILVYGLGATFLAFGLLWRGWLSAREMPPSVQNDKEVTSARTWVWVVGLLILGVMLRLPDLGYHELHTDEVVLLTRARDAMRGVDDALEQHTKGPGEIAVITVIYRTLDTATESMARLPFALTSVASILAVALLGRRLYSAPAGIWAGVLLAFNGFALALSRIAQYQPAVLLFSILAVYAAWEFAHSGRTRWLALSITLATWGALMHYELVLAWPALALMTWFGWQRAPNRPRVVGVFIAASALGAIVLGVVYLRILLNPYFSTTEAYLDTRMGDLGQTFNLAYFVEISTFYNATWFLAGLLLFMLAGIFIGWRWQLRATLVLLLWFAPYLILYLFVVRFPGTHFYTMMPSWSLLAALPLAALSLSPPARRLLRYTAWAAVAIWLAISAFYLYLVFFRQNPEYVVNYRQERVPFYWAPYGENIPAKPRFGLPIYEGWKTLGVLAEWHYLTGTYASNEYSRHLRWYLGSLDRVAIEEHPDFIFVAEHLQEPDPDYRDDWLEGYQRIGEIQVRGEPRIAIWSQTPLPGGYVTYPAEQFADVFPGLVPALQPWSDPPVQVADVRLGERVTLASAGVDRLHVSGGETLLVELVWRPDQPIARAYKLFVHLMDVSGQLVTQWDGMPGLNTSTTTEWRPGEPFTDRVFLEIPPGTPRGSYVLLVGLYDPETAERLGSRAVEVATIDVD